MNRPPRDPGPKPASGVSPLMRTIIMALAGVLDAAKLAAFCLVLFAPLLIGVGTKLVTQNYLEQHLGAGIGGFLSSAVGVAAGTAAAAIEFTQPEIDAAMEALGLVLAWVIALAGCIILMLLIGMTSGGALLEPRIFFGVIAMCTTSLMPFIDGTPTLTLGTWNILREMKRRDAARMHTWKAAKKAFDAAWTARREAQREAARALTAPPEPIEEEPVFIEERLARQSPQLVARPAYGV